MGRVKVQQRTAASRTPRRLAIALRATTHYPGNSISTRSRGQAAAASAACCSSVSTPVPVISDAKERPSVVRLPGATTPASSSSVAPTSMGDTSASLVAPAGTPGPRTMNGMRVSVS
jgi:hypothetical protein